MNNKEEGMNQQKALELLINAVKVANKRGAFELEESVDILKAVQVFTTPKQEEESGEAVVEDSKQ